MIAIKAGKGEQVMATVQPIGNDADCIARLFPYYERFFDLFRDYALGNEIIPGFAAYRASSGRYFLSKKAKLYEANTYEYVLFYQESEITTALLKERFAQLAAVEPLLVKPSHEHYCTYLTIVLVTAHLPADSVVLRALQQTLNKLKFTKNYKLSYYGFSQGRILIADVTGKRVYGNKAGKTLIAGLEAFLDGSFA